MQMDRTALNNPSGLNQEAISDTTLWRQILRVNLGAVPLDHPLRVECQQALQNQKFSDERGNVLANVASDLATRTTAEMV